MVLAVTRGGSFSGSAVETNRSTPGKSERPVGFDGEGMSNLSWRTTRSVERYRSFSAQRLPRLISGFHHSTTKSIIFITTIHIILGPVSISNTIGTLSLKQPPVMIKFSSLVSLHHSHVISFSFRVIWGRAFGTSHLRVSYVGIDDFVHEMSSCDAVESSREKGIRNVLLFGLDSHRGVHRLIVRSGRNVDSVVHISPDMSRSSLDKLTYRPLDVRLANLTVWPLELRLAAELEPPPIELRIPFFDGWLDKDAIVIN
ncbi:hypothetical protein F8388_007846 [Cannabis sativa]|uniref:Uncharacterized protein n=1 Tax=Cannabis sativa TaxID=3483 RepID=A0A7J6FW19_CANSA|nr:hypothetical protein F8388_007846 [Cannabis sativa]